LEWTQRPAEVQVELFVGDFAQLEAGLGLAPRVLGVVHHQLEVLHTADLRSALKVQRLGASDPILHRLLVHQHNAGVRLGILHGQFLDQSGG